MFSFLPLVLKSSASATIAVDLGSFFTKSSKFNSTNTPKIAENTESKRLTPSFVAFRIRKGMDTKKTSNLDPSEVEEAIPAIGNKALSLMEMRPFMGAGFFTYNCDLKKEKSAEFAKKMVSNSTITRFSYEDSLALYLHMYTQTIIPGPEAKKVGVIVPATFTIKQRKIIENAVRNAKVQFSGIIDDNEAVFTYYAVERIRFFNDKPQTVLFIDVGASSVKSYAARFELVKEKGKPTAHVNVTKLSYSISNKEGGAFVTARIMDYVIEKYKLENLRDSEKRRLFTACEQIKKNLALQNLHKTQQYVEDIGDNPEMTIVLTEEEVAPLLEPLFNEVVKVAQEAAKNLTVDDIQMIGGSTRLKGIGNFIQEKMNLTVRSNLNQEETVAVGGGYALQYKLKQSRLSAIQWNETFPVLSLKVQCGNETHVVCTRGESPCNNTIVFDAPKRHIDLIYNKDELPLPLKNEVVGYNTSKSDFSLTLQFEHAPTRIVYSSHCNGTNCTTAYLVSTNYEFAVSPAYSTILKMEAKRKAVAAARSDLESYTHRILDYVEYNETFKYFMSDSERFTLTKQAEKMSNWLNENANSVSNESTFRMHKTELRSYVIPVEQRITENRTFTKAEDYLKRSVQLGLMASFEWKVNRTWINKTTLDGYNDLINQSIELITQIEEAKRVVKPWEKFPIKSINLTDLSMKLYKEAMRIEAIPPPLPPKREDTLLNRLKNSSFIQRIKSFFANKPTNSTKPINATTKKSPKISPKPSPTPVNKESSKTTSDNKESPETTHVSKESPETPPLPEKGTASEEAGKEL